MIAFAEMKKEILKTVFSVGSTYITQENTNPSNILGFGTWERVKGRVLVGFDEDDEDFDSIGKIGGAKTHTLTINEMPKHSLPVGLAGGGTQQNYGLNYSLSDNWRQYEGGDIIGEIR